MRLILAEAQLEDGQYAETLATLNHLQEIAPGHVQVSGFATRIIAKPRDNDNKTLVRAISLSDSVYSPRYVVVLNVLLEHLPFLCYSCLSEGAKFLGKHN